MNPDFHIDGIDITRAVPAADGAWRIDFASTHMGLCHQLYLNGVLAGWTDWPDARSLVAPAGAFFRRAVVAAVPTGQRMCDFSGELSPAQRGDDLVYRPSVARNPELSAADFVEVLAGPCEGALDGSPLVRRPGWSSGWTRWGFGQEAFGQSALGVECSVALGFGRGAFGAGPVGLDAPLMDLPVPLSHSGRWRFVVRTRRADGRAFEQSPFEVTVVLPPG